MEKETKLVSTKSVELSVEYGQPNFKWQMVFNAFSIEKVNHGCLIRFAYSARSGSQTTAAEIVPIILSREGLEQMKAATKNYIGTFGDVPTREADILPNARQFSPLFSNHARVSYAGDSAEIAFFTILLHDIANATKGALSPNVKIPCVQVALLHSDITVHRQLILELMNLK